MMVPEILVAAFATVGVFFLGLCVARLRLRRPLAAARSGAGGILCLAISALLLSVGLNLYTWHRLTAEQPVATLSFRQLAPQRYSVRLKPTDRPASRYTLVGDQWQLDARVLKWSGLGTLLGLDARYRLERLSGRYTNPQARTQRPRTTYDLVDERGLDVTWLLSRYPQWLPLVDATYGSATYLPMADGARYRVSLSRTGLLARPVNDAAQRAIGSW